MFLIVAERVYRKLWSQVFMCVDKALKTPNGFAWILFKEEASVAKSLKLYHEGHAAIYGSPFIISVVDADIQDAGDAGQFLFSSAFAKDQKNRREALTCSRENKCAMLRKPQLVEITNRSRTKTCIFITTRNRRIS